MKVLNLYAGIGGNRKLWENVDVTAIEINPKIGNIYRDFFPNDKYIIQMAGYRIELRGQNSINKDTMSS